MRKVMLLLFSFLLVFNFVSAQGYLQDDGVTTHATGITINEVSAWSFPLDYNADGVVLSTDRDEYIELVNSSDASINIQGWILGNKDDTFTFPDISIAPAKGVVIFCRDADITNFNPGPGNFVLKTASTFALAHAPSNGDAIGIRNEDDLYIAIDWGTGDITANTDFMTGSPSLVGTEVFLTGSWIPGQSRSRSPDYTGSWASHSTISGTVNWSNDSPTRTLTNPQGSPGRVFGEDIPLPVELISFKAIAGNGTVNLRWETSSESENQGFKLLRSDANMNDFKEIASYENEDALLGAGSTSEKSSYQYIDKHIFNGVIYYYKLVDVSMNGVQTEQGMVSATPHPENMNVTMIYPQSFALNQNYPNPFNPSTKISFSIPKTDEDILDLNVSIYNQLGQKVKSLYNGPISPGEYELEWNGLDENNQNVPSGIYLYHLKSSNFSSSKKMILIR